MCSGWLFWQCQNQTNNTAAGTLKDTVLQPVAQGQVNEPDTTGFSLLLKEDSAARKDFIDGIYRRAEKHFEDKSFHKKDSFYEISVGNILSRNQRHAFVKVLDRDRDFYFSLYLLSGNRGLPILSDTVGYLSYVSDSIADINGDGIKEFYRVTYSTAGCCRRNLFQISTLDPITGRLNAPIQLLNPTFYPKEKLIRGVEYGHSGEVPLYKAKWDGNKVAVIEYIYPLAGKPGFFLKKRGHEYEDRSPRDTVMGIPGEYRTVKDLDWFLLFTEKRN